MHWFLLEKDVRHSPQSIPQMLYELLAVRNGCHRCEPGADCGVL